QRYKELQQKEQIASRLETLINVLPGGVVVLDKKGVVIESNPVAETFLEPKLVGQYWRDVIKRCFAPKDDDGHEVSNSQGKRISIVTRSLDDDGQIILLTDQTETRQLQANLSRNERLSALGKMVSTLAHQVRTPLSSAVLYANHLSTETLTTTQRQSFTTKLLNRLNFMERQIRDMLLFVKGDMPLTDQVSLTQLQDTLAESIEMPIKAYGASCQWKRVAGDGGDSIREGHRKGEHYLQCNLDALIGALLNLVNNSLQTTPSADIIIQFKINADQLVISILDNGPGIDLQQKEKIQDMFFTTKGQGTGIGLSVVNIVAQSHGGSFELTNRKQGGACARLCLPLV
ncbi:MAG: two-component system sensor histidine kinase FlrB, partial [Cellvibrionaceae bacterium]